jgi:type VI secretion system protein ImpM
MFWRRKNKAPPAPPQIGCFGKLPATGDFVRLNAGGEEVASFDRWLGSSIDHARRVLGQNFEAVYPHSVGLFIFHGEVQNGEPPARAIVGAWCASGDNAGRLYPMAVFGSYDYAQLVATGAALPIALWPLLTAAYELATNGRYMPVDVFLERVSHVALPSLDDPEGAGAGYRGWLTTQPMRALWETTVGSEAKRFWVVQNIAASVEPFRGQDLPNTSLCLRLPIGAGDAYAAAVWMDMTLRLAKWKNTLLNAFWSPQKAVLIHMGPPHVATYRELISPTTDADHVADFTGNPWGDEATARRALGPQLDALVARTDLSLASFLEGLGQP